MGVTLPKMTELPVYTLTKVEETSKYLRTVLWFMIAKCTDPITLINMFKVLLKYLPDRDG